MCCACVKICPEQARKLDHPMVVARREMLISQYSTRKEPLIFMGATDEIQ
jgi:ferredoxin